MPRKSAQIVAGNLDESVQVIELDRSTSILGDSISLREALLNLARNDRREFHMIQVAAIQSSELRVADVAVQEEEESNVEGSSSEHVSVFYGNDVDFNQLGPSSFDEVTTCDEQMKHSEILAIPVSAESSSRSSWAERITAAPNFVRTICLSESGFLLQCNTAII